MVQDYGFRNYDPLIARFISVDPLKDKYPWYTPYQFAGNTPIQAIDLDGLEPDYAPTKEGEEAYAVDRCNGENKVVREFTAISDENDNCKLKWSAPAQIPTAEIDGGAAPPISMGQIALKESLGGELTTRERDYKDFRSNPNPYSTLVTIKDVVETAVSLRPNVIGITISANALLAFGGGGTINLSYMRGANDGIAGTGFEIFVSGGGGVGYDASLGISAFGAYYKGNDTPNYNSLMGWGVSNNISIGPFGGGVFGDQSYGSTVKGKYKPTSSFDNWIGYSAGVAVGPDMIIPFSGSQQYQYAKPLRINIPDIGIRPQDNRFLLKY